MILLTDIAAKLQTILNSYFPSDFEFVVKSAGYHLDSIVDKQTSRNTIPVFVNQVGGEYNPVPNLHQINTTYEVTLYYPVSFKDTFYALNSYLEDTFVGKKIVYGSENALCNISVAEYGEIIEVEALRRFENWIAEEFSGSVHLFKKEQQVNEFYMSMQFRLYCTTLAEGLIFGNDVTYKLTAVFPAWSLDTMRVYKTSTHSWADYARYLTGDDTINQKYAYKSSSNAVVYIDVTPSDFSKIIKKQFNVYTYSNSQYTKIEDASILDMTFWDQPYQNSLSTDLIWATSGTGVSVSPVSQQLINVDKFAKNISNIVNFNKSTLVYPQDNVFWDYFLYAYNTQNMQSVTGMVLTKTYSNGMEYKFNQITLSANENIQLGDPLSFTLTYGDRK